MRLGAIYGLAGIGHIAQLVEHRTFNLMAIGSSPIMPRIICEILH